MTILQIRDLRVRNRPSERLIPRRLSIDGLTLGVAKGDRVLVLGGPGAGKDTLTDALRERSAGIELAQGYNLGVVTDAFDPGTISDVDVLVINRFHSRDYPRADGSGEIVDPNSTAHWAIVRRAKFVGATLLAMAELDKLASDKINLFSRKVLIDEGRLVADTAEPKFQFTLERWVNDFARERHCNLRRDCALLKDHFGLKVLEDWL